MSNRAQRRAERKKAPKWEKMSKNQLMTRLTKNGITPKDLETNYNLGVRAGIDNTYKICFASVCLALNDTHKFGAVRCHKVLERMQHYIINDLTVAEAVHDVYKRMNLRLDLSDPEGWISMEDD